MAPDEIVKMMRAYAKWHSPCEEAADLIERQAKALEEAEKALDRVEAYEMTSYSDATIAKRAIATIRAARGEKEDG